MTKKKDIEHSKKVEILAAEAIIDTPVAVTIRNRNASQNGDICPSGVPPSYMRRYTTSNRLRSASRSKSAGCLRNLNSIGKKMKTADGTVQELLRVSAHKTDILAKILAIALESEPRKFMHPERLERRAKEIKDVNTVAEFGKVIIALYEKLNPVAFTTAMRFVQILNLNAPSPNKEKARRIA
jgi:hypothetical protein